MSGVLIRFLVFQFLIFIAYSFSYSNMTILIKKEKKGMIKM